MEEPLSRTLDDAQRREALLLELDRLRERELVDAEEHAFLRARYTRSSSPRHANASVAAYATHLIGGLLLGAAIVALVQFFVPVSAWQPAAALGLSALALAAAHASERRRGARAAEAGLAAGLVAAASIPFYSASPSMLGAIAVALVVTVALLRRGFTALTVLSVPAFFVAARHTTGAEMLRGSSALSESAFVLALIAYAVLLARQRHAQWASYALAAQAVATAIAIFPLLDALRVTDAGIAALAVGATLGIAFFWGLRLGERPTVVVTGALLTFAAVSFAFLALGPALAAIVLLCLGAALVWQAETLRGYFQPLPHTPPR